MNRCVIIGGAEIKNYEKQRAYIRDTDFIIYCDCGLRHMDLFKLQPHLVVGDFDTFQGKLPAVDIIRLPREKDDTDTFFAAKEALKRGFSDFLFLGTIGGRIDHTFANLSILLMLDKAGCRAMAVDDYSEMEILTGGTVYIPDKYKYFSTLNISGIAEGINIKNAKYPLENGAIGWEFQYGISNEVLPGETAEISINSGSLLIVKQFKD